MTLSEARDILDARIQGTAYEGDFKEALSVASGVLDDVLHNDLDKYRDSTEAFVVVWESTDGPSAHGPFDSTEAARAWTKSEAEAWGHIEPDQDFDDWYANTAVVWVVPLHAPGDPADELPRIE